MQLWMGALALLLGADPAEGPSPIELEMVQVTVIEQIQVPAREKGTLAELNVREGDVVQKGLLVGSLDAKQAGIELRKAKAELDKAREESQNNVNKLFAEASLKVADAEYRRAKEVIEKFANAISKTEMERLELTVKKSALQIEQSDRDLRVAAISTQLGEIAVDAAKELVERHSIESPLGGMVVQLHKRPGEWVNPGDPVVRILRLDRLRVEGFVEARQHGLELKGRAVTLVADLPGAAKKEFKGQVVFVSPEVEAVTGQFRVWAEVENADFALRPGVQGRLTIHPVKAAPEQAGISK